MIGSSGSLVELRERVQQQKYIYLIFGFEQDIFGSRWILYRRISSWLEHNKVRHEATIRSIA